MKKLYLLLLLLSVSAGVLSCQIDDLAVTKPTSSDDTLSEEYISKGALAFALSGDHKITADRAGEIALTAFSLFEGGSGASKSIHSITPLTLASQRTSRNSADTLLYVVNYNNSEGCAIISFDDRDGEVIAYFENGNFNLSDTAEIPVLKMHIDAMLSWQRSKLEKIKEAAATGRHYVSYDSTLVDDSPGLLSDILETLSTKGSGGPDGPPGPDNPNCAKYSGSWVGGTNAIDLAENRYTLPCFGTPGTPPVVPLDPTWPGGFLGDGTPCPTPPYCSPPLRDMEDYYNFYGCSYHTSASGTPAVTSQTGPLLTTAWDQESPLNHGSYPAGCGPIAVVQIMAYHAYPSTYSYNGGSPEWTNLTALRTKTYNSNIASSGLGAVAKRLVNEIGDRLNVIYTSSGSAVPSLVTGSGKVQDTFESFGYEIGAGGAWNYQNDSNNFSKVKASIEGNKPIFIYGFPPGFITNYFKGHCWVLDGYKKTSATNSWQLFRFNQSGYYVGVTSGSYNTESEYVHANYGWGAGHNAWVRRGVYDTWDGDDYSGYLYFIPGIEPDI